MKITLALDRYDRHFPFFDGTVKPPAGIELNTLQVGQTVTLRDGHSRHERMIHDREFDICEFSMSTYLMAIDRGLPLTGIPIFPRRLFSAGLFYVHADSSFHAPADLAGRRVGLNAFQTTLSLLAKGDLKFEYGVPWEEIAWFVVAGEKVPFDVKAGVRIERLPSSADLGLLLENGDLDAVITPHPPKSMTSGQAPVRRLFADPMAEELRYFRKYKYFPIMHILAVRKELSEQNPWLAPAVMTMFAEAHAICQSYYDDPNWSSLLWGRTYYERERAELGSGAWRTGFKANRANLERFIQYSRDQNLIGATLAVDDLFSEAIRAT